jgi:glycosyltransferase involved in cell wall biosynthesis
MRLSIVTVSFDQQPFLERALTSVLRQDVDDLEYIVVDAGSTDGSRTVIDRYRERLAKVILEPDRGPADGLNKGFSFASGDAYAYVNADDALLPGAARRAVAFLAANPRVDVLYANGYIVDAHGTPIRRFRSSRFTPWRFVHGGANVMQQATFIRADAFRRTNGFNIENRTCWDAELLVDLALTGARMHRVDEYWGLFTTHSAAISGSQRLAAQYESDRRELLRKVHGRLPRRRDAVANLAGRALKWSTDPVGVGWRLADLVRPPRIGNPVL